MNAGEFSNFELSGRTPLESPAGAAGGILASELGAPGGTPVGDGIAAITGGFDSGAAIGRR